MASNARQQHLIAPLLLLALFFFTLLRQLLLAAYFKMLRHFGFRHGGTDALAHHARGAQQALFAVLALGNEAVGRNPHAGCINAGVDIAA